MRLKDVVFGKAELLLAQPILPALTLIITLNNVKR